MDEVGAEDQREADADRHRQHPLPDGDARQQVVDEVRRPLRHAASTTAGRGRARPEAASFAGDRDQAMDRAVIARHPEEALFGVAAGHRRVAFVLHVVRPWVVAEARDQARQRAAEQGAEADAVERGRVGLRGEVDGHPPRCTPRPRAMGLRDGWRMA